MASGLTKRNLEYYPIEKGVLDPLREKYAKIEYGSSLEGTIQAAKAALEVILAGRNLYPHLSGNPLFKEAIQMARAIVENKNPFLTNSEGEEFDHFLVKLKGEMFVDDFDLEEYDQVLWYHNDFWTLAAVITDWKWHLANRTQK